MKIKLNRNHLKLLGSYLKKDRPDLFKILSDSNISTVFEIGEDHLLELRDWSGEQLQLIGFDENYELTDEGKVLEDLIDIFYTDQK